MALLEFWGRECIGGAHNRDVEEENMIDTTTDRALRMVKREEGRVHGV